MKRFEDMSYAEKIKWRIRASWLMLIAMLVYMVVVGELGGGDSRIMTDMADLVSRWIFFGGFIYIASRIYHNKKLMKNRGLMKEQKRQEQDERNQYLHDKSGGAVMDVLLVLLLFTTMTAAMFNMAAFYTSLAILMAAALLKAAVYWLYSRGI